MRNINRLIPTNKALLLHKRTDVCFHLHAHACTTKGSAKLCKAQVLYYICNVKAVLDCLSTFLLTSKSLKSTPVISSSVLKSWYWSSIVLIFIAIWCMGWLAPDHSLAGDTSEPLGFGSHYTHTFWHIYKELYSELWLGGLRKPMTRIGNIYLGEGSKIVCWNMSASTHTPRSPLGTPPIVISINLHLLVLFWLKHYSFCNNACFPFSTQEI